MEGGGMPGSGVSQGMLGLDVQQQQIHQQQRHRQQPPQQQFLPFPSQPQSQKPSASYALPSSKQPKQQQQPYPHQQQQQSLEEHHTHESRLPAAASVSPWQRMKWTDGMVKLLIMVVYFVGDEAGADHPSSSGEAGGVPKAATAAKKGAHQSFPQQQQQKKGKWKSVSRAMMERGYSVSPQQCEDKFNDLNKRYKRVNDLLGRGVACRVVENQSLLDTMDHLSPKAKEEARKLLNSKHLFFREMCAYHTSCAAAAVQGGGGAATALTVGMTTTVAQHPPSESTDPSGLHQCVHPTKIAVDRPGMTIEEEEDEDNDDSDDSDDEEDGDEDGGVNHHHRRLDGDDGEEDEDSKVFMGTTAATTSSGSKRQRRSSPPYSASPPGTPPVSQQQQRLKCDLMGLTGPVEQQRQWVQRRATELEERNVGYQRRALELERQRFKWQRFSGNKEREMEKMRIQNERLRLDSERMLLLLRQKELDLACGTVANGGGSGNCAPAGAMGVAVPEQQRGSLLFQQSARPEPGSLQGEN